MPPDSILSESEENATAVLDARGSKYIMADFDMVYGKLPALTCLGK